MVVAAYMLVTMVAAGALVASVVLGQLRLRASEARSRDGVLPGALVASMELRLTDSRKLRVPGPQWSILLFADHSLLEFPDLLDDIRVLASEQVTFVVLAKQTEPTLTVSLLEAENLDLPVVADAQLLYSRFGIVGMPSAAIVDEAGVVRGSGLVNQPGGLATLWSLSHADPTELRDYLRPRYRHVLFAPSGAS